jgi:hypothetical protein
MLRQTSVWSRASNNADIGTIGYEIAVFADRAGDVLTPEVREELKCLMLSRR